MTDSLAHLWRASQARRALAALLAVALSFSLLGAAPAVQAAQKSGAEKLPDGRLLFTSGHTDIFDLSLDEETKKPVLKLKEDITGSAVHREPQDVVLGVKEEAKYTIPAQFKSQLKLRDSKGYLLPITQNQDLLWPGWDSLGLKALGGKVTNDFIFEEVRGPGQVYIFTPNTFFTGPEPLLLSKQYRVQKGQRIRQTAPAHVHTNWWFTKPGIYTMKVSAVVRVTNKPRRVVSKTYTWAVGDRALNTLRKGGNTSPEQPAPTPTATAVPPTAPIAPAPPVKPAKPHSGVTHHKQSDKQAHQRTQGVTTQPQGDGGAALNPAQAGAGAGAVSGGGDPECRPVEVPAKEGEAPRGGGTRVGDSFTIPRNTHVHPNWVFTAPGTYRVRITLSAKAKSGKVLSAPMVVTFNVGGSGNANEGHFDIGPAISGGRLLPLIKDDRGQPARWVDSSALSFGVGARSKATAPAGLEFIAPKGAPIWMISSTQVPGVPWVGANTMHPSVLKETTGAVTWRLDAVQGPGALAVFTSGNLGQAVGQRWFGGLAGGQAGSKPGTTIVGRTADGKPCKLSGDVVSNLQAQGKNVDNGSLPNTGIDTYNMAGIGALVLLAGIAVLTLRRRFSL